VGPEAVSSFVDGLSSNDAGFEVLVGQGRILTLKEDLTVRGKQEPLLAAGDPTVIDFRLVNPRQIRVIGLRIGVTDLSITTADGRTYSFEVRVIADLGPLRAKLQCMFPDTVVKVTQLRDQIVVEGQARDTVQVGQILQSIRGYLLSIQAAQASIVSGQQAAAPAAGAPQPRPAPSGTPAPAGAPAPGAAPAAPPAPGFVPVETPLPGVVPWPGAVFPEQALALSTQATVLAPQIINLLRVPGSQQVLLKVRVAELNRTGLRQVGADTLLVDHELGNIAGTQLGVATIVANGTLSGFPQRGGIIAPTTTLFGIFEPSEFQIFLSALRRNSLLKVLAEPNLVALNGQQASFLAGGEFPVPVTQSGGGGAAPAIAVQFQEFGVRLGFVPYILDNDTIRLTVDPEVSTVDFTLGTVLVPGGTPVPGLNTRKAHTVVEMHQGQTLAIAGLMQLSLDGSTNRIPVLGDLPVLGPFFSNTSGTRMEKELIVLVTPYLVEPMNHGQVPPTPGDEVEEPNDLEFYLLNRIEGRTGRCHRSTTEYDDPLHVVRCLMQLENDHVRGPHGFCD
jgi:pilus assembly protein CpaC